MSQAKLTNIMPLILEAAKVVVEKDLKENVEYETYEISGEYTIKAIMSSGFSIGNPKNTGL